MELMLGRFAALQLTYNALQETTFYFLVKLQNSFVSVASFVPDDMGIYYFIPAIMKSFSLSLQQSIDFFFYGLLLLGFILILLVFYFQSNLILTLYALFSFYMLYREGFLRLSDTYIAPVFCTFSVIPALLFLFEKITKVMWYHYIFLFFAGLIVGYSHYIRIYSSLAVLVFCVIFLSVLLSVSVKHKLLLFSFLALGVLIPVVQINYHIYKSSQFLKTKKVFSNVHHAHPLWHNIYAGLGYMENYLEIKYEDECARKAAEKICPGIEFCSKEYEKILRKEVIKIALKERFLFGSIVFAKLGVILFFILACSNIGLIAAYFYPKGFLEYIFWIAMSISALPGLMVVPRPSYLSGLASFAFVYGIFSIIYSYKKFLILKNKKRI